MNAIISPEQRRILSKAGKIIGRLGGSKQTPAQKEAQKKTGLRLAQWRRENILRKTA